MRLQPSRAGHVLTMALLISILFVTTSVNSNAVSDATAGRNYVSLSWEERKALFEETDSAASPSNNERLVALLRAESQAFAIADDIGEDQSEYFAALIVRVSRVPNLDALNALLLPNVISVGGIAVNPVAARGDTALPVVLEEYSIRKNDDMQRVALIRVLSRMVAIGSISTADNLASIRHALTEGTDDSNPYVRMIAVRGLALFRDKEAQDRVRRLANEDTYSVSGQLGHRFPVRETATSALSSARKH